ncbi:MAG: hypothetical protein ACRC20_10300 [Segniliparus sp.]|uniref:hypothetical protein n=1 Tax=Segniliparus sp. TaxID=2804064 RepID=UPI003F2AFD62
MSNPGVERITPPNELTDEQLRAFLAVFAKINGISEILIREKCQDGDAWFSIMARGDAEEDSSWEDCASSLAEAVDGFVHSYYLALHR